MAKQHRPERFAAAVPAAALLTRARAPARKLPSTLAFCPQSSVNGSSTSRCRLSHCDGLPLCLDSPLLSANQASVDPRTVQVGATAASTALSEAGGRPSPRAAAGPT
jgi:hypothetical protein